MADTDITLAIVMDHLRGMENRLSNRIDAVDRSLSARMEKLDKSMDSLENRMEWMYRNLTTQIDGIDKRLDAIEIEFLPTRVSRIEKHLNLAV